MRMRTHIIIELLLICFACAKLSLRQLEELEVFEILGSNGSVYVNPDGLLNFLHAYMHSKNGHMHNKRYFSSEINVLHSLSANQEGEDSAQSRFMHTKNAPHDQAYSDSEGEAFSLIRNFMYHASLIEMFPSENQVLSIDSEDLSSFTNLLRAVPNQKSVHKFLASLCLLSEGVFLDIKDTDDEIALYQEDGTAVFSLKTDESDASFSRTDRKVRFKAKNEISKVLFFFRESLQEKKLADSFEQYTKGTFLSTSRFLIQTYIYEYIESTQDAKDVIESVYEILSNVISKESGEKGEHFRLKRANYACSRLFVSSISTRENSGLHALKKIKECVEGVSSFPFTDFNQLPAYRRIPEYTQQIEVSPPAEYSDFFCNHTESALYTLMCCLLYDRAAEKCVLEGLPDAGSTKNLKDFFTKRSLRPPEVVDLHTHKAWNKVVSGLSSPDIRYVRESKNQLSPGVLNMLLVISEITGKGDAEKSSILRFMDGLKTEEEPTQGFYLRLRTYVASLLGSLLVNKEIEVECMDFAKSTEKNGLCDVYGEIHLKCNANSQKEVFAIKIEMQRAYGVFIQRETTLPEPSLSRLQKMAQDCKGQDTFLGFLFWNYAERAGKTDDACMENSIMNAVKESQHSSLQEGVNRILVLKKIEGLKYKKVLVDFSVFYSINCWQGSDNPGVRTDRLFRFALNVLGSARLDNTQVQKMLLPAFIYTNTYCLAPKKLKASEAEFGDLFDDSELIEGVVDFALNKCLWHALWSMMKNAVKKVENSSFCKERSILYFCSMKKIFTRLFMNGATCINRRFPTLNQFRRREECALYSLFNLVWLSFACEHMKNEPEIAGAMYDYIFCIPKKVPSLLKDIYSMQREYVLSYMRAHKKGLQERKGADLFKPPRHLKLFNQRLVSYKYDKVYNFFKA
ncbi:uncharacterized protein NEMAJ01_2264 [Nematocida major]|uniref:uncharacterized protein n=1 Tax=Nematocida major TaxID=1912982 RepID=UPI002008032C|nr:uncharacterized protein NEMAJ01_2264 [Nematocida major]KAH9387368.1 hypothetical protein NEMAJ01_2264 [Nematocida major]